MDEFVSVLFIRAKGFGLRWVNPSNLPMLLQSAQYLYLLRTPLRHSYLLVLSFRIAQIPEVFVSPNLELNPFRSLPYITVQLPSAIVSNVINKRASKEASWPSLFHMYTRDLSLPTSSSSSSFNFRRLPSCTSNQLLPSNAIAAAAANGCHPTDTKTSATPAFSAASCEYLCYSSVVTVVERLYFLSLPHASEWVEDEEQHTDWAVSSFFLSHAPG